MKWDLRHDLTIPAEIRECRLREFLIRFLHLIHLEENVHFNKSGVSGIICEKKYSNIGRIGWAEQGFLTFQENIQKEFEASFYRETIRPAFPSGKSMKSDKEFQERLSVGDMKESERGYRKDNMIREKFSDGEECMNRYYMMFR